MNCLNQLLSKKNTKEIDIFRQRQKHFGPANRDKILYYIEEDNKNMGFFAMYRCWMEYLYFADICGYTPVIYAGDNFAYKENKLINGTDNPFEYYFTQPASISPKEVKVSSKVIMSDLIHRKMVELILTGEVNSYRCGRRYLYMMGHIVKKYMHFNDITQSYLDESLKRLGFDNQKILGIHVRGTDFRFQYDNHPVYVSEEDCFVEIDRLLKKNLYGKIFLATDDERILTNFAKRYGNKLCFYEDAKRSNNNKSVAFSSGNRENHKYLLGLEVIRDMYTLSICSGLVAGISQVAVCAQVNKVSYGRKYEDLKIIDKGIYRNAHAFIRK